MALSHLIGKIVLAGWQKIVLVGWQKIAIKALRN